MTGFASKSSSGSIICTSQCPRRYSNIRPTSVKVAIITLFIGVVISEVKSVCSGFVEYLTRLAGKMATIDIIRAKNAGSTRSVETGVGNQPLNLNWTILPTAPILFSRLIRNPSMECRVIIEENKIDIIVPER